LQAWIATTEACTDESLKAALAELSTGCAAELTNKSPHAGALFSILSHYKDIRYIKLTFETGCSQANYIIQWAINR
jgi:hypothetical protein